MKIINPQTERGPLGSSLPAYVSNGLVGLRLRDLPVLPGVCIVNGVVGLDPERRIEAAAYVPFPLALDLAIDGARLSTQPFAASSLEQDYDFSAGELTTRVDVVLAERKLSLSVRTFCSRSHPHIVLQETEIRSADNATLTVESGLSLDKSSRGNVVRRRLGTPGEHEPADDGALLWESDGGLATCGFACWTEISGQPDGERLRPYDHRGPLQTRFKVPLRAGQRVIISQMTAVVGSLVHSRPDEEAVRRLAEAKRLGMAPLRKMNRDCWTEIWKARPVVEGASSQHQAIIDAGFYYLNASVHPASPSATSIFGLAQWPDYHYYYGHVMWDIDAFCVPVLSFTQPHAARAILEFRERGVDAARRNARSYGNQGLRFPWEAGALTGEEVAPGRGEAATHALHVSMHVARAFSIFADVSGDRRFLEERTWPVLAGVADFICDRVAWREGRPHLLSATGPAEIPAPPDDDAFSIIAGRDVLERAVQAALDLGKNAPSIWRATSEALHPLLRTDNAIAAHADFRIDEQKGATPTPLAALFPYNYPLSDESHDATLALYLSHWRDYVGSPMLPALYPVWASLWGDRRLAFKLFEEGYAAYDAGRFHQCLEYRADHPDSRVRAGPFFANIGGMLTSLYLGLPRLAVRGADPATWPKQKITLPAGWRSISVERLWIRGEPWSLQAAHRSVAELKKI
ncbi:glycoside hydrolase family 65 protein [Sphingomonas sabuli]|uniref:Glycoside hydrolase family 65 protein n=1 Tax=Sphingomonas sabuli TaxID=2764186 RepID=A0A7G9L1V6_9SPHN|nr:glycoside hydrolase family 65 protein [Sphingomonas sabuli]QNM82605.1 glycoside hydrolase family 65 protein [Sphingomonas sabuli]